MYTKVEFVEVIVCVYRNSTLYHKQVLWLLQHRRHVMYAFLPLLRVMKNYPRAGVVFFLYPIVPFHRHHCNSHSHVIFCLSPSIIHPGTESCWSRNEWLFTCDTCPPPSPLEFHCLNIQTSALTTSKTPSDLAGLGARGSLSNTALAWETVHSQSCCCQTF